MFKAVSANPDVNEVEEAQLAFWREHDTLKRTMEQREGGPHYVFYEGPPTANGLPGSHHVLARSFKDIFPRYKTMRGYHVIRKAGWDTHGLPVEIAVEKELGITDKRQVEEYGIAEFNEKCRQNVFRNINDWERLTERIAFWVDLDDPYITYTNDYIESVWWILKQLWEKDLLYRGYKVVPYSPSSGTPLSSHEVSQGYEEVTDLSVYVRFPLKDEENTAFLAWTTTPWTLPGNVALAVGADIDYVRVRGPIRHVPGDEELILAEALLEKTLVDHEEYEVVERCKGRDLVGTRYDRPYTFMGDDDKDYEYVVAGDFVSTVEGTGIVHIAPAFGQDDMDMGREHDLPTLITVTPDGRFLPEVETVAGLWFKDADPVIAEDLKERGLLYRSQKYKHSYPHNWRDGKPLMYLARETWFIRTTAYKDKMVALNQTVNWVPTHIRDGRFGNWLDDLKEWALGRERYWGTPLPVWVDEETGDMICVGSVEELSELAGEDLSELDLHRPYVDEITFPNPNGGGTMRRVPEVIDVWFDSGAMQVAQWGYPRKNQEMFEAQFPADYICEAIDQTRGWFYSLHAIAAMLFESVSYKNVICLGHILDAEGQKMSKSKGNTVDPWDVIDQYGADVFRWYMFTAGPPGEPRRFSVDLVGQSFRAFWLTLWNTYRLFVEYANIDNANPAEMDVPVVERPELDRWILAKLHTLVRDVTEAYENYDVPRATRPVESFVINDLSNWYVRRAKSRLWASENDASKQAIYLTLHECLVTVSKLLAPAMPFVAEEMYRNLVSTVDPNAPESVHLAMWPEPDEALIDETLVTEMDAVRVLVSLGLAARNDAGIKVRQPLAEAAFALPDRLGHVVRQYADLLQDELNVKTVRALDDAGEVVNYELNPLPSELGARLKGDFPKVKNTLTTGDQTERARALLDGQDITVEMGDTTYTLTADEVEVRRKASEGYAIAEEGSYVAALVTALTDDLLAEGLAREFVRRVQMLRKDADFNLDDRIVTTYTASDRLAKAIAQYADYIKTETLSEELTAVDSVNGEHNAADEFDGETVTLSVKRV